MNPTTPFARAATPCATAPSWMQHCLIWLGILCFGIPIRIFATQDLTVGVTGAVLSQLFGCLLTLAFRPLYNRLLAGHRLLIVILLATMLGHLGGLMDVLLTNEWLALFPGQTPVEHFGVYFITRSRLYLFWSAVYCAYIYRQFSLRNELDVAEQKSSILQLEALVRAAEIRMLRAQVSPHFLFNALTVAIADLKRRPDTVRETLNALADYFRYAQMNRERTLVPLGEEYDAILQYLIVQKACLRDQLVLQTYICASARCLLAPGLLLQPLVENALQHGRRTDDAPLQITIEIRRIKDRLRISIANSGDWFERLVSLDKTEPGGSGLPNLRHRLALYYGDDASLTIKADADRVDVVILLPALDTSLAGGRMA